MKTHHIPVRSAAGGFVSTPMAIVLTVIIGGASLLAYEWHSATPKKEHGSSVAKHHHKKHDKKTAAL